MGEQRIEGGCQCGAVRYAITTPLENPHICHCRMCQKAFGSYFAALVGTLKTGLAWTRGQPSFFRSSSVVDRGFCKDCGTPLSFAYDHSKHIAVSIGSLDDPDAAARLIGARSLQIALGAPVLVKTDKTSPTDVARLEFHEKLIPMTIKRKMPSGQYSVVPIGKAIGNWVAEHNGEI